MIVLGKLLNDRNGNSGKMLSNLAHAQFTGSTLCYRLKFFVAKNHLRSSFLSNCSLLGSCFARSFSTRPSQMSKYTEGVAVRMRVYITVQKLSRKCVQEKKKKARETRQKQN